MSALVDRYAAVLADAVTDPAAITDTDARQLIARCKRDILLDLAAVALVEHARSTVRLYNLDVERAALQQERGEQKELRRSDLYLGKYRHGSAAAAGHGCECDSCQRKLELEERLTSTYWANVTDVINKLATDLRANGPPSYSRHRSPSTPRGRP